MFLTKKNKLLLGAFKANIDIWSSAVFFFLCFLSFFRPFLVSSALALVQQIYFHNNVKLKVYI